MSAPEIRYASVDTPIGPMLVASTRQGLVWASFPERDTDDALERLARELSPQLIEDPGALDPARREIEQYFEGKRRDFELALDWSLVGPFARRVLKATTEIPYGGYLTYGELAAEAGSPGGARAVGNALGSNPIVVVIPCHRVVRAGGFLGGYGGRPERKRQLLALEGAPSFK